MTEGLREAFASLSTAVIADAVLRLKLPVRVAPAGVCSVRAGTRLAGRVLPVRHYGSVDIFLEAMTAAQPGDVLVIDNGGRTDEACIGDLTALEARAYGLAGLIYGGCTVTPLIWSRSACPSSATAPAPSARAGWMRASRTPSVPPAWGTSP